jgi:hypothetical protein
MLFVPEERFEPSILGLSQVIYLCADGQFLTPSIFANNNQAGQLDREGCGLTLKYLALLLILSGDKHARSVWERVRGKETSFITLTPEDAVIVAVS